jgi:hypothetical protein
MAELTRLHAGNSALFRPKAAEKQATIVWQGAKYALSGGTNRSPDRSCACAMGRTPTAST